eukprot:CAMPEP_0201478196 /NCGR_PEP_ID=MMETSP0151_2-20130828/3104_1 /ASSEMBLY_ACC=CAM_ASM_000257 /TAXON_ID=200890 /ORGANISM="Paramoeba atlantica, Strain 621/1 / CCAP 1560/9" /LENGTH=441 /DNA_ID=CAMNT_0047859203 /DNA_START=37 /DNA_END=1362 /DNA_ORIENTATION=-
MAAEGAQLVTVEGHVGPSAVLKGIKNQVHVYFETVTGESAEEGRPPVDLCLVLDRSGSMRSKNKMSTAKAAIKGLVEKLSEGDRLALVVYDTKVSVVMGFDDYSVTDISGIFGCIDRVDCQGTTNLHGGLKEGFNLFKKIEETGGTTGRNKKIFLFSDGLVNAGETDPTKICNFVSTIADSGITVDSFGIGDDFNEDLMQNIGEFGCGRFLFIESSEAMDQFVSFALKGVLRLVARQATLKVRGAGPSIAERVYDGDLVSGFALNDLTAKNTRGVLVEVSCSPSAEESRDRVELLKWELDFINTNGDPVSLKGTVDVMVTDDDSKLPKSKNPAVAVALLVRRSSEIDEKADALLESGKRKEATALKEELLAEMTELSVLAPDNVKLKSLLIAQKRSVQELKDTQTSVKKNQKISKKNQYRNRRDSMDYCLNDMVWECQNLD